MAWKWGIEDVGGGIFPNSHPLTFMVGLDKLFGKNGGGPCQSIGGETRVIHGIGIGIALIGPSPIIRRCIQNQEEGGSASIVKQEMSRC